jgi:hypothetical protein
LVFDMKLNSKNIVSDTSVSSGRTTLNHLCG